MRIATIIFILFVLIALFSLSCASTSPRASNDTGYPVVVTPDTNQNLNKPPISEWRYELKTSNHTYLTKDFTKDERGRYILRIFWVDTLKGEWEYHTTTFILDPDISGNVQVSQVSDY